MKLDIIGGQYSLTGSLTTLGSTRALLLEVAHTDDLIGQKGACDARALPDLLATLDSGAAITLKTYDESEDEKYGLATSPDPDGFWLRLTHDGYSRSYALDAQDRARIASGLRALT